MNVAAPRLEDRLGPLEPPYRSRGEAQVGRLLDRYGIPFFYEMPVMVQDRGQYRLWHPDFTLPEQGWLIVEYAGMPDVPDYAAGIQHKKQVYRENGLSAIFILPTDLRGQGWPSKALDYIQSAYSSTQQDLCRRSLPAP
jgi:hypothetical protein